MLLRDKHGREVRVLLWLDRADRLCVRIDGEAAGALWLRSAFGRHPDRWVIARYGSDEGQALIRAGTASQLKLAPDVVPERTCSLCGCHDLRMCPDGCHWVAADLCSRCEETKLHGRRPMTGEDFLQ